ncbi:hypothetical protein E2C01_075355 [Portunus trituberculatus]|uniref:Plastocyanin-like domain-containing protein n=1 Tax=Portunus trituberculatus TaxID=210409 RepID=A0A5B7IJX1_PORTR|nr:hypothetical protein [Portunus trituberculatus]
MVHINGISFKLPSSPPLHHANVDTSAFCNDTARINCDEGPVTFSISLHNVSPLIFHAFPGFVNHPFHLHGHSFYVVGMGQLGQGISKAKVRKDKFYTNVAKPNLYC